MTNEVYNSSTHGPIPLSFTGRRLLANLRAAVQTAIDEGDFSANDMQLSHARGELAEYMSKLEGKRVDRTIEEALAKIERDAAEAEARKVEERMKRQRLADAVIHAEMQYNVAVAALNTAGVAAAAAGIDVKYRFIDSRHESGRRLKVWAYRWPSVAFEVRS
jgi:imidazolonepropionase-like amidohydrolase